MTMTTLVVGEYQYDENNKLGEGNFGTVYKGNHRRDATQIVAVKRIRMAAFKKLDKQFLDREIDILRKLSEQPHPNIVLQLHIQKTEEAIYIVMEFCNGGSLQKYLNDKGGKLDEETTKLFVKQIVNGMIVLHTKNIIHRDLKPDNIMLCRHSAQANSAPSDITLKIVDFGIGRVLLDGEMADTQCGTPGYAAPEICSLTGEPSFGYNHKVDLWSIGIIIRQCITGVEPIKFKHLKPQYPYTCSSNLQDLLKRLLCKDPDERIDYDAVLQHMFFREDATLGNLINVFVEHSGPSTIILHLNENDSVDSLIEATLHRLNTCIHEGLSEMFFVNGAGSGKGLLEYGSGRSLSDVGITNCSTIIAIPRLLG